MSSRSRHNASTCDASMLGNRAPPLVVFFELLPIREASVLADVPDPTVTDTASCSYTVAGDDGAVGGGYRRANTSGCRDAAWSVWDPGLSPREKMLDCNAATRLNALIRNR